jgi:hypothetical protein
MIEFLVEVEVEVEVEVCAELRLAGSKPVTDEEGFRSFEHVLVLEWH